ncbi:hypothetical protein C2845_PM18G02320 [Panicum miliaceum]|uniref:Uncharacterized protein n=1 Tax=Panicum miliaceum TaxID=4540 RepID=A0A3L6PG13_PANMI|nr:hypothetical protein C2845_PM18G02320 [Panicum miliaceum]
MGTRPVGHVSTRVPHLTRKSPQQKRDFEMLHKQRAPWRSMHWHCRIGILAVSEKEEAHRSRPTSPPHLVSKIAAAPDRSMAADATPDRSIAAAVASSLKPSPPQPRAASPAEDHRRRRLGITVPPHVKAAAGSLGGVVEACCLQPADVVKTRLQLDRAGAYRGAAVARWRAPRGANASLQSRLRDPATGALSTVATAALLASGLGAGVVEALLVVTPFEAVMTRLQQQRGRLGPGTPPLTLRYRGPIHCARRRPRGRPPPLWAGAVPTVLRNGANQAAMFTCKSRLDAALWGMGDGDGRALRVSQSMASGFIAAAVGPLCTGPFDVVKSRLMAHGAGRRREVPRHGALPADDLRRGRGPGTKGFLPRLVRIPAGGALAWAVTDQVTALYDRAYLQPAAHL